MEALSDVLLPYKEVIGGVAAVVTIGQMFSGVFLCMDIFRQGNTKGISAMPFLGGIVLSVLNLRYGTMLRDTTMIQVNLFGLGLNIAYYLLYFHYTQEKLHAWSRAGLAGAISAGVLSYVEYEDQSIVENRLGLIITVMMFTLIASPLFSLNTIIKNKSTEGMPFPMIVSGFVVTLMWLLYGITIKNNFIISQNIVGLILCGIQLSLFVIYPTKPKQKAKSKSKKID